MRPRRESLRDGKRGRERCFVVGRAKARVVKSFCKKNVCLCVYIASGILLLYVRLRVLNILRSTLLISCQDIDTL